MTKTSRVGSAVASILIENEAARVTRWEFARRGDNTGWHHHHHDYVVVPLFDGTLEIVSGDGKSAPARMQHGEPYFRTAGIEHDVLNGNDFACAFIEIELLR